MMGRFQACLKCMKLMVAQLKKEAEGSSCVLVIRGAAISLKLEAEMTTAYSMKSHFIVKIKIDGKLFSKSLMYTLWYHFQPILLIMQRL